jgi:hypothetical protein
MEEPMWQKFNIETALPIRAKERRDNVLPNSVCSRTDTVNTLPTRVRPWIDRADPRRAKLRILQEEYVPTSCFTDVAPPNRTKLRTESTDPRQVEPRTEHLSPRFDAPATLNEDPSRTKDLRLVLEPRVRKSRTEHADPNRPKERVLTELLTIVHPVNDAQLPKRTWLRTDKHEPLVQKDKIDAFAFKRAWWPALDPTDKDEPTRTKERTLILLPMCAKSKALNELPKRPKARTLMVLPR